MSPLYRRHVSGELTHLGERENFRVVRLVEGVPELGEPGFPVAAYRLQPIGDFEEWVDPGFVDDLPPLLGPVDQPNRAEVMEVLGDGLAGHRKL